MKVRKRERDVGGVGSWVEIISCIYMYIGVLHLNNYTHTHTHTGLLKCPGTLVVCPASLMLQWEAEVNGKIRPGLIRAKVYHGSNRTKFASE